MIKVEKVNNGEIPDIKISNGINSFLMVRNNAPDLYWYPEIEANLNEENIIFIIKEADGDIYTLFTKLYQDVIDGNLFPLTKENLRNKSTVEKAKLKTQKELQKREFQKEAQRTGLIDNGVIKWHSDDYDPYEYAAVLTIEKEEEQIKITFSKNKKHHKNNNNIPTYHIRFDASGSRYGFFWVVFANFYVQLGNLEWEEPNLPVETNQMLKKSLPELDQISFFD